MSKWFWIITIQQVHPEGRGWSTTTLTGECDLPDGISRGQVFDDIRNAAASSVSFRPRPTVLFFSLEPAALTPTGVAS